MSSSSASIESRSRISASGTMADAVRGKDWTATSLGSVENWPDSLLSLVNFTLSSVFPAVLFWGQEMITIYNDSYVAFLQGKHPEALGLPGREVWSEIWPNVGPQYEAVLSAGITVKMEGALVPIRENGVMQDYFWNYALSPVYEEGRVAGVLNVVQNITKEVLASRERDAVTRRFQQVLKDTNDAILTVDRDWRVSYLNPRAQAISTPIQDAVGKSLWVAYPGLLTSGAPWIENYYRAMNGQTSPAFEAFYGSPLNVWLDVHVEPSEEGITIFFQDITERKKIADNLEKVQNAVARSEAQLRTITDALPSLVAYIDHEYRYVRANRTYFDWFGIDPSTMVGRTIEEILGTEVATPIRKHLAKSLAGQHQEFETTLGSGEQEKIVCISHIPDLDSRGKVHGVIVQAQDISARKRAEQALIQTEKLAAAGRLAATIAHEINNPLESMTNLLYLARKTQEQSEVSSYLELAEQELRRVSAISSQTLRFHRQSTRPTEIYPKDLLDSVLPIFQGRIINARVELVRVDRPTPAILCREGEIRQVLLNLLGNALDALHSFGGRLVVRTHAGTDHRSGRSGAIITVADTGSGIPTEVQPKLFQAFYTTKGIGGTGLGLWVSREIVHRHQGTLTLRSSTNAKDHGTVFRLFLPYPPIE